MRKDKKRKDGTVMDNKTIVLVISNEVTDFKLGTMELLLNSAFSGQLAYIDCKNEETGEVESILAALELGDVEGTMHIYPVAKFFNKDTPKYAVPDGRGNYLSYDPQEPVDFRAEYVSAEESRPSERLDKKQIN